VLLLYVLSPPILETYSLSTAFSPLGTGKSHTGPSPVNRGNAVLVGYEVLPRSSGQGAMSGQGYCHGAAACHLTSMMQVTCATMHIAAHGEL
jgi:hypothetical protein